LISEWKEKYIDYDHLKKIINSINSVHHYNNDPNIPITGHFDRNRSLVIEEKEFLVQLSLEVRKVEEFYFLQLNEAKKKELLLESQLQQLEKYHNGQTVALPPSGKNNDKISGYKEELGEKKEELGTNDDEEKAITWTRSMNHIDEIKEESEEKEEEEGSYIENQEVFQLDDDEEKHLKEDSNYDGNNDDNEEINENQTTKLPWKSYVSQYLLQNNPRIAKTQLRKAFIEFYRFLELLKSFRDLNIMAYKKIVKKFEKNSRLNLKEPLIEELSVSSFYRSNDLTDLMAKIEECFRLSFIENKNRGLAMKALRTVGINPTDLSWNISSSTSRLPYSIFLAGISFGIGMMLILMIALYMTSLSKPKPRRKNILAIIYFGFGFPILDAILIGINMHIWDRYKVNYRLIFGLNPRTSTITYFSFVSSLGLLYLILVSIGLFGHYNDSFPLSGQVYLMLGIMITVALSYLCFFDRKGLRWFLKLITHLLTSPSYPCRFRDFFIADQLASMIPFYQSIGFLIDYTINGRTIMKDFTFPITWYTILIPLFPFWIRCMQCLRRYYDGLASHAGPTQLYNCGRYCLGMMYLLFSGLCRYYNDNNFFWIAVGFGIGYSCFSYYWDIIMDWGLGKGRLGTSSTSSRKASSDVGVGISAPDSSESFPLEDYHTYSTSYTGSKHPLITYPRWVYFFIMITDLLARFVWSPFLLIYGSQANPGIYIISLIEILRRFQWNFFRVEIEHVHNCEQYQVIPELPLPFATKELFTYENEEEEEREKVNENAKEDEEDDDEEENEEIQERRRLNNNRNSQNRQQLRQRGSASSSSSPSPSSSSSNFPTSIRKAASSILKYAKSGDYSRNNHENKV
jgi:hypothetical protein